MSKDKDRADSRTVPVFLSEMDAARLCATREWISDLDVVSDVYEKSKQIQAAFTEWPTSPVLPDIKVLEEFYQNVTKHLQERVETRIVHQEFDPFAPPALRVKVGAVLKVKSAALETGVNALALILAIFATSTWHILFSVWVGLSAYNLVKSLFAKYEELVDPDEILVFEAIFRCQGRLCVINYEALQNKNYDEAYGTVNPNVSAIEKEIGGTLANREIMKALASLKSRGVLSERDGRWSIVF